MVIKRLIITDLAVGILLALGVSIVGGLQLVHWLEAPVYPMIDVLDLFGALVSAIILTSFIE